MRQVWPESFELKDSLPQRKADRQIKWDAKVANFACDLRMYNYFKLLKLKFMDGVKASPSMKPPGRSWADNPAQNSTSRGSVMDEKLVKQMLKKEPTDYYGILDISSSASDEQIKKAYKKQAFAFHPDKNTAPGAAEAFKMVGRAFSVLGNPEKRKAYDISGAEPIFSPGSQHYGESSFVDPEEIFRAFFREFASTQGEVFFSSSSSFHGGGFSSIPRRRGFRFATPTEGPVHGRQQEPLTARQIFAQLVPIFVLIFLSFLNSLLTSY